VERYQTLELELGEGDFAERIWKVDVSLLVPAWFAWLIGFRRIHSW